MIKFITRPLIRTDKIQWQRACPMCHSHWVLCTNTHNPYFVDGKLLSTIGKNNESWMELKEGDITWWT